MIINYHFNNKRLTKDQIFPYEASLLIALVITSGKVFRSCFVTFMATPSGKFLCGVKNFTLKKYFSRFKQHDRIKSLFSDSSLKITAKLTQECLFNKNTFNGQMTMSLPSLLANQEVKRKNS